jgi:hypothetical protein
MQDSNDRLEEKKEDVRGYASRHPRRMNAGVMMAGMAAGAGMMMAAKNKRKSSVQKFIQSLGK